MKKKNIDGQKFGRLTVINDTGKRDKYGDIIYLCKCDCGNYKEICKRSLRRPTVSCGCSIHQRVFGVPQRRKDPLYWVWVEMKDRCFNVNSKSYRYYGDKGVTVCNEWLVYDNFRKWAISNGYKQKNGRYGDKLSIDRINSNGNYEPQNCRFITVSENISNMAKERWQKSRREA